MTDDLSIILLQAKLDKDVSYNNLEQDIESIQKQLNVKGLSIKLNISDADLKHFTTQIASIQTTLAQQSKKFKFYDLDQIKKDGNEVYKNLNDIKNAYKDSGRLSFPNKIFDPATKDLQGFTMQIAKADGEIRKLKVNLIDVVSTTLDKAGNKVEKLSKMWQVDKITEVDTSDFSKQTALYAQKDRILKSIYDKQMKLINAGQQQTQILNQQLIKEQQMLGVVSSQISRGGFKNTNEEARIKQLTLNLQEKLNEKISQEADINAKNNATLTQQLTIKRQIALDKLMAFKEKNSDIISDGGFSTALKKYEDDINNLTIDDFKQKLPILNQTFSQIKSGVSDAKKEVLTLGGAFKEAFTKFPIWIVTATVYMQFIHQVQNAINYTYQMDNALTDLNKVVDLSANQMSQMKNSALELGSALGKSSVEVMKGMAEWGRYTKNLEDIQELTNTAIMASNVTSLSVADASKALTTSLITFKLNAKDSMMVLDSFNEIQNNFKTSAEDLANAIGIVGSVAQQSGMSIQQLEGYVTAISSATGLDGNEVGTALKSMVSRVYRVGPEGAEDAGKAEESLAKIGVAVRDAEGNFRNFSDILSGVESKWKNLTNVEQSAISQAISGTMHYNKFLTLMQNFGIATDATNKALNSQGSATRENQKYLDSMAGKAALFQNALERMYTAITSSDALKSLVVGATSVINAITGVIDTFGFIPTVITTAITAMALAKSQFIALEVVSTTVNGKVKLAWGDKGWAQKLFSGFNTSIEEFIAKWIRLNAFTEAKTGLTGLQTVLPRLANGFKILTSEITATSIAEGMATVASVALTTALTLGLSVVITALITGLTTLVQKLINAKEEQQKMVQAIKDSISTLADQKAKLQDLAKEYETLSKNTNKTAEEKDRQKKIEEELVSTYGVSAIGINEQGKAYTNSISLINARVRALQKEIEAERQKLEISTKANDAQARRSIIKDVNKQNELYDEILKKQNAIAEAKSALNEGENTSYKFYNRALAQNLTTDDGKQTLRNIIDSETVELNELMNQNDKVSKDLEGSIADRALVIQNSANDYIAKLEESGIKVSDSSKAFVEEVSKSIAFRDIDLDSAQREIQGFIQSLQNSNLDKLIGEYSKFKEAILKNPKDKGSQTDLSNTAKQIQQTVNAMSKDFTPNAKASKKGWDEFVDALKQSYPAFKEHVPTIEDVTKALADMNGVVKDALENQKDLTATAEKMQKGEKLTADEAFKLAEAHSDLIPYIKQTADGYTIEVSELEKLRKKNLEVTIEKLKNEKDTAEQVRKATQSRIEAYKFEAYVLQGLQNDPASIKTAQHRAVLDYVAKNGGNYQAGYNVLSKNGAFKNIEDLAKNDETLKNTISKADFYMNLLNTPVDLGTKTGGNKGSDYNQQYTKEFMAEADRLGAKISQLQNQYKKLQEQGTSVSDVNKVLNEIAYTQQLRQNALKKSADDMRAKQAELAKSLLAKGVNVTGSEDEIDRQVKKISAKNRSAVIQAIQDFKQLGQSVLSASTEWWNVEFEKTQTLQQKLENIQKQKKNINDLSMSALDLQLKQSEYTASQYDETSKEYENQLVKQLVIYKQKQAILRQESNDLKAYLKTLKEGTEEYVKTKQEIDTIEGSWYDLESTISQVNDKLKEIRNLQIQKVDDAREKMQNLIKAEYDLQKKAEDDRHNAVMKNLDREMQALEEKYAKEDYERNLKKQNQDISKKQSEIDAIALDTSTEGLARRAKLEEELAQLKEKKEDTRLNHQKEMEKNTIQDLKDAENNKYETTKSNLDKLSSDIAIFNQVQVDLANTATDSIIEKYKNMAHEIGGQYDSIIEKAKMVASISSAQQIVQNPNSAYNTIPDSSGYTADGRKAVSVIPLDQMIANKEKWAEIDAQQKVGKIGQADAIKQKQDLYTANNSLKTILPTDIASLVGDGKVTTLEQLKALREKLLKEGRVYADGGPVDFTGLAWVDGSKSKPEYVLKNEDFRAVLSILDFAKQMIPAMKTSNIPNNVNSNSKEVIINPEINVYSVPGQDAQEIAQEVWALFDKQLRKAGITV